MKALKLAFASLCMISSLFIASCTKDDSNDISATDQTTSPNFATTGGLMFKVMKDGAAVSSATIGIAISESGLTANTYLASRVTDANGKADFGQLNDDNYYYEVDVTIGGIDYHGEGVVQVQAGVDLVQELTLQ